MTMRQVKKTCKLTEETYAEKVNFTKEKLELIHEKQRKVQRMNLDPETFVAEAEK